MHRLLPIALALLLPSAALAQSVLTLTFPDTTETATFSGEDCGGRTTVNWTVTTATQTCTELRLWVTAASCGDDFTAADFDLGDFNIATVRAGTVNIDVLDLPGWTSAADGGVGCSDASTKTWKVCGYFETPGGIGFCSGSNNTKTTKSATLKYDGLPPPAPTLIEARGIDGAIRARVTTGEDTRAVRFAARPSGDTSPFVFGGDVLVISGTADARIEGLSNGQFYEVAAIGVDSAGNQSGESNILEGKPNLVQGFWGAYKDAGGSEAGGCAAAPGLVFALASITAVLVSRRRRS